MSACRGCGAEIRFIRTRSGAQMPVDPEHQTSWITDTPVSTSVKISLQDPDGALQTGYIATVLTAGAREISGYRPHWATCPKAQDFKKGRETL